MFDEHYWDGLTAVYHDDVGSLRVEVLKNQSSSERVTYTLKVLEVLELFETVPGSFREVGKTFYCDKPRNSKRPGLWTLVDD